MEAEESSNEVAAETDSQQIEDTEHGNNHEIKQETNNNNNNGEQDTTVNVPAAVDPYAPGETLENITEEPEQDGSDHDRPENNNHQDDREDANEEYLDGSVSRPDTRGTRIPSQQSRVRLSRTSDSHQQGSGNDEELNEDAANEGVLITEVREAAGSPITDESNGEQSRDGLLAEEEDEDGWDTDLDIEEVHEEHDPTGRTQYFRFCEQTGVIPVSYFARHITDNTITMRYHGLGVEGTRAISKILKDSITLEHLNLSGNDIGGEGAEHLAKMLQENDYITDVTFADNFLGSLGAQYMARMLMVNSGLRRIDLSGNGFGDSDAELFANAIETNKFLRELVLSNNSFGQEAGEVFGPSIGANDVLDHLDLSWNQIRRKGAAAVGLGTKENVRLKTCNVSWNGFGPEGGAAIADALTVNSSLLELDISGNRLDGYTASVIGKALAKNDTLKTLKMGNNPITTSGSIALVACINQSDNSVLDCLDLTDIPVEYEFLRTVKEIQSKRAFRVVHGTVLLSGNTSEDVGKRAINPRGLNDPLLILRESIVVNDTRILDFLQKYDVNDTHYVTQQQFASALEDLGVPYSPEQLSNIAQLLNKNGDGQIYYGGFLEQLKNSGEPTRNKYDPRNNSNTPRKQVPTRQNQQEAVA